MKATVVVTVIVQGGFDIEVTESEEGTMVVPALVGGVTITPRAIFASAHPMDEEVKSQLIAVATKEMLEGAATKYQPDELKNAEPLPELAKGAIN